MNNNNIRANSPPDRRDFRSEAKTSTDFVSVGKTDTIELGGLL